jgi:hypothetical protein
MPKESKAATSVALAFAAALLSASAMSQPLPSSSTGQGPNVSPAARGQLDELMARMVPATTSVPSLAKEPEPWLEMGPPVVINCIPGWCEFAPR